MKVLPMPTFTLQNYLRIGKIIPKQQLTLFTGLPSVGKSYTLFKFLNLHNVAPIWFNLDEDPALLDFEFKGMSSDKALLDAFMKGRIEDFDNEVIVIDTYSRLIAELQIKNTLDDQRQITDQLLYLAKHYNSTIIILGHPDDYVGKSSIFNLNQSLVRDCHEHIHIDKIMGSGKKLEEPLYRTYVNKGRGLGGTLIMDGWLREPVMNPLTDKLC